MFEQTPYGHAVHEYFVAAEREALRRRAEARGAVKTKAQLLRLRAEVRRKLRACFGPLPQRTPLNARTTGTLERRHFTIEKVLYESRPGLIVTANLYLPRRSPGAPRPAVLAPCGHSQNGKAMETYQAFVANLARQGYVVLIYDPLSQGERLQYPRPGRRPARNWPRGCCQEHNMMGNQMSLVGEFFGAWRLWDGIRSLDYLLSRPEVDGRRVGVTGNSGGGTLTTFLTALDDRFAMAAPSCFVTQYLCNLENELPADSEQCPPGLLAAAAEVSDPDASGSEAPLDMADFFIAAIPRPTLLLGQAKDYFDRRGLEAVYAELKRLYEILGRGGDVELFVGPREHGFSRENREAMYRFFNRCAGVEASGREPSRQKFESEEALWASPTGQVHRIKGARRVFDFTRATAAALARARKRPARRGSPPLAEAELLRRIRRRLALPSREAPPHYRAIRLLWPGKGKPQVRAGFAVETGPPVQGPDGGTAIGALVHVCRPEKLIYHFPECPQATIYVPHLSAAAEVSKGMAPKAEPLFAVEVRGIGQLAARTCAETDFFAPYGSDYMYAAHAQMLGQSYCGLRVHDLLSVLDLFQANGCRSVHLVGRGLGSIWATLAACLHRLVKRVTLHNALLSYHELTQVPVYAWPLSSLVFGVLKDFDLPDLHRLLRAQKKLRLLALWNSQMRPKR